jgi:hypothetical protein
LRYAPEDVSAAPLYQRFGVVEAALLVNRIERPEFGGNQTIPQTRR